MTQVTYPIADLSFDRSWISEAALQVVNALQTAGFDGYLVGGCVRDLLLQRRPKDFDVATNASPQQVKLLFRRARIIGRRFQIVHVRFGREVIEVATYRAKPGGAKVRRGGGSDSGNGRRAITDNGRVVDDNVFGTLEQDASRRDFTINSLYYDPNQEIVVDFVSGVKDIRKNTLRMIGNAAERFTEDPVRMLRALRFRAKLGLELERALPPAIAECCALLADVPGARLFDEVLKMFHHGHARTSWHELCRHGLAEKLFPLTAANPAHEQHDKTATALLSMALANTDQRIRQRKPVIPAFLFAVLLWRPFIRELKRPQRADKVPKSPSNEALWAAVESVFSGQSRRVAVPRRVSETVAEIWAMQFHLQQRQPKSVARLLASKRFRAAYDFLLLRQQVGEVEAEVARWWTDIQNCDDEQQQQWIENLRAKPTKPTERTNQPKQPKANTNNRRQRKSDSARKHSVARNHSGSDNQPRQSSATDSPTNLALKTRHG